MNDILKREINHAYIPQDVQVAIDTILSYAYTITLENQVLRRRLEDAKRLLDDREIDKEIVATHMNTEASASTRICKIANETPPAMKEQETTTEANDMAAMRDACQKMRDLLMLRGDGKARCILTWDEFNESQKMLRAALAARPRNCDIYTDIDSAFRACQEDRGYLKSPIDERRSVISFMLSTNTSGEANKDEGEPDESK